MASHRASGIISDLRQDTFARDILQRVDMGPYVIPRMLHPLPHNLLMRHTGTNRAFKATIWWGYP